MGESKNLHLPSLEEKGFGLEEKMGIERIWEVFDWEEEVESEFVFER